MSNTETRGQRIEKLLTEAYYALEEVKQITEEKIDVPFLLSIVASYRIGRDNNTLAEGITTPSEIFDETVMGIVDNSELLHEKIEEEEDGE